MKQETMEMPKKLTREQKLVESILKKRQKYGPNTELTYEERELVMKQMREK